MEKGSMDGFEPAGGLAEVSAVSSGSGRRTVRLGNARLLDVVSVGRRKVLEFKGSKRDPVRADVQDLMEVLERLMSEPEKADADVRKAGFGA